MLARSLGCVGGRLVCNRDSCFSGQLLLGWVGPFLAGIHERLADLHVKSDVWSLSESVSSRLARGLVGPGSQGCKAPLIFFFLSFFPFHEHLTPSLQTCILELPSFPSWSMTFLISPPRLLTVSGLPPLNLPDLHLRAHPRPSASTFPCPSRMMSSTASSI